MIKPYYAIRQELHSTDGLLFKNSLLVIPTSMRPYILELIHEGHLGIDRCLRQARSAVYWPNITVDIKNKVEQCLICLKFRKSNIADTLMPHEPALLPWQKVAVDFFYFKRQSYLLVVDYFSKYIEYSLANISNASQVILILKSMFARHGIPIEIVSDNGPPFSSIEFKNL